MGLATPAIVKYPQPNLTLDYTATDALDRFGRVTDHAWKNTSGTSLVQIRHGYDRIGNRLYREDVVAANNSKNFDELYAYDGMNQLTDMQRGRLNTTKNGIASGKNYQDNFAFDATGTWSTYKQDTTGAGFNLTQARTHNAANEVLTVAGASTHVANDANGNMTKVVKPDNWNASFTLVYDAWNRLVIVKDGTTTVATYFYDGVNHRVKKVVGTETRLFYFNRNWQCLEEYVGTTCDACYVWGLRYIDDLVTYRKGSTDYYSLADANWNVVALTNASGVAQERYTYSAFGKLNIFDAAFNVRAASACSITRTFTGPVLDNETGFMLYRNRVYHTTLGRFVQRDPIGYEAGDVSLYRYVGNQVIVSIDSNGTEKCGPRVWVYTGDWCVEDNVWDAAMDAAGKVVSCWWECEVEIHKCVAGQMLTVTETVSGVWSAATARIPKLPHEIYNPADTNKGLLRDIINRLGGRGTKLERIARASTRGGWGRAAGVAKGTFVVTLIIEAGISAYCGYSCS
jgi:RHS repeat-associated protein